MWLFQEILVVRNLSRNLLRSSEYFRGTRWDFRFHKIKLTISSRGWNSNYRFDEMYIANSTGILKDDLSLIAVWYSTIPLRRFTCNMLEGVGVSKWLQFGLQFFELKRNL